MEKGERGYIKRKKSSALLQAVAVAVIGVVIFLTGYFMNGNSTKNLLSVVAILSVLPGARYLTRFFVLWPYRTVTEEFFNKARRCVGDEDVLLVDLVITSAERVMNLDALVLTGGAAFGLTGKKGQDAAYITEYLAKHCGRYVDGYEVHITDREEELVEWLAGGKTRTFEDEDVKKDLVDDIMTLIVE